MRQSTTRRQLARDAKAIVALAFRNGPIETLHAGSACPTCDGRTGYSKITDSDMAWIMSCAVDCVYSLLRLKTEDPERYEAEIRFGEEYTTNWDDPV